MSPSNECFSDRQCPSGTYCDKKRQECASLFGCRVGGPIGTMCLQDRDCPVVGDATKGPTNAARRGGKVEGGTRQSPKLKI
ncbi:hypothetical protein BGZ82_003416 [Podila clonocystis]|nr:hypothetical protein BGZ82_003416 [Podila clonocystis]